MILSLSSDENNIYSHQLRLALALKGGRLESHNLSGVARSTLISEFRRKGSLCLADNDIEITNPLNALLYIDDMVPSPPLFPPSPAGKAAVRHFLQETLGHTAKALESMDDSSGGTYESLALSQVLLFWDNVGRALQTGNLTKGICGERMANSAVDAAAFPLLHRIAARKRRNLMDLPSNTGTAACYEYLIKKYSDDYYRKSMTIGESEIERD